MSLAEAQALIDAGIFLDHDAAADSCELRELANICYGFSPIVGIELSNDAHCLLLDISGCDHLFGDESGLARRLLIELGCRGYFAHVAVANTIGAAWAIARHGHGTGTDRRLRSLPIEALRISARIVTQLHEFDLRTIGRLRTMPRGSLPSRFGAVLTERLDQLFGQREELLEPLPRPEPVLAEWATDEPICHPDAIRYVCEDLLAQILKTLKSRGQGLLGLTLSLHSEASEATVLPIGLALPTDSPPHILNLIELKLEATRIPEWIHMIQLEASSTAVLRVRQQGLFAANETADNGELQRLTDRLSARLGQGMVTRAQLLPEPIPEQAVGYEPISQSGVSFQLANPKTSQAGSLRHFADPRATLASARPLILLHEPPPIDVTLSNETPASFCWNQRHYRITECTEVERITTAWWQDSGTIRRDYYQVTTTTGSRYWLFCELPSKWFLHGVFE